MLRWVLGCLGLLALAAVSFLLGNVSGRFTGFADAEEVYMPRAIRAAYGLSKGDDFTNDWSQGNLKDLAEKYGPPDELQITELVVEGGKGHATVIARRKGVAHEESITFSGGRVDLVE